MSIISSSLIFAMACTFNFRINSSFLWMFGVFISPIQSLIACGLVKGDVNSLSLKPTGKKTSATNSCYFCEHICHLLSTTPFGKSQVLSSESRVMSAQQDFRIEIMRMLQISTFVDSKEKESEGDQFTRISSMNPSHTKCQANSLGRF